MIRSTWLRLGLLSVVVLALVAAVGVMFARGVTRPVRRLQRASARLAAGDLAAHVEDDDGPPELRDLAKTFDTRQLFDVLITVGGYRSKSMLINSAGVQLDANMADYRLPPALR